MSTTKYIVNNSSEQTLSGSLTINGMLTNSGDVNVTASTEFVGSIQFSGTNQYLSTVVNAGGTVSITYEMWFYQTSDSPSTQGLLQTRTSTTGSDGIDVSIVSGSIFISTSGAGLLTGGSVSINTWYHIAIVRDGDTNWTVYLNGSSIGTFNFTNTTGTELSIGRKSASVYNEFFIGYISNFRYVIGTAVYTSNFTPPTTMLTAIAGTDLLLNTKTLETAFTDSSINNLIMDNPYVAVFSSVSPSLTYAKNSSINVSGNINVSGTLKSNSTGIYRALLTQTGQIVGNNLEDFNYGLIIGETYSINTYVTGDDFSNIADVVSGNINETGCVFTATGQIPTYYNNSSELTSGGNLIVDVLENTLGYDLIWQENPFGGTGNIVAFNSLTGPVYNCFPRDKTEIITQFKYPYGLGGLPFIIPSISSFIIKDSVILLETINFGGGGPSDDILYYTPIEIKINQDNDITPIEVYGVVIPSFPFSDVYIELNSNGNHIQDIYCYNQNTVNNMSELLTLLNNDINNVYDLVYSEGGPYGIKVIMPTNIKNQFCSNGTLSFQIFSYD